MSIKGIKKFANVLHIMQTTRQEFLRDATVGKKDIQDMKLARLLDDMKDLVKDNFANITLE